MKPKVMGVYSLIFSITSIILLMLFTTYVFIPAVLIVMGLIAVVCGLLGIITSRKKQDKTAMTLSVIGIFIALFPLITGLILSPILKLL